MLVDSRWLIRTQLDRNWKDLLIDYMRTIDPATYSLSFRLFRSNFKTYRSGVQLQQIDRGRGEFPRFTLRLRLHHALREEHVFKGDVFRHDSTDGSSWEKASRDRAETSAKRRRHRPNQSSLQMLQ